MINVRPYFRSYKSDSSKGTIWVRFYIKGEKVHFSTKIECFEDNWNDTDRYIRSSEPNSRDKNLIIENIISRINNVFVKFRLKDVYNK